MRLRTINDIAAAVRGRRVARGQSQAELAVLAGVSRKWLVDLEAGKSSVEMGLILRVFDALDLALAADDAIEDPSATMLDDLLLEYRRG